MEKETFDHLAACPYCGQVVTVQLEKAHPTEEELTEAATEVCRCFEAEAAVRTKKRLKDARFTIAVMFSAEEDSGLRDLIYNAVELIVAKKIAAIQINIGFGRNIKIKDKRDNVQIVEIRREADAEEV